jgi:sugar phosphate isomerase/epimerase
VKSTSDGEFVTVQNRDANVSVAKKGGFLLVHVVDKESHGENVDVKMPMAVADALVAPGNQDLDLVGAIRALAAAGDTELVNVKDRENTVRVWLDSKNTGD